MAAGGFCLNPLWAQNWYNTTDSVTSSISQTFHIRMCHMGLFPPWDLKSLPLLSHSHALFFVPLLFLLRIKRPENDSTFRPVSRHLGLIQHDSSVWFVLNEVDERLGWSGRGLHGVRRSGWTQSFRTRHSQVGEATFHWLVFPPPARGRANNNKHC